MMDYQESELRRVTHLIKEVGIENLGYFDGCCCSHFAVRNVHVDISCGKGGEQAIRVWSNSMDYDDKTLLAPIMDEVYSQVVEKSGRSGDFVRLFEEYKRS